MSQTPSTGCTIRISDVSDATVFDVSDGAFSILHNNPPSVTVQPLTGEKSGDVAIVFTGADAENDSINLTLDYSLNGGAFTTATIVSGATTLPGANRTVTWDSFGDEGYVYQAVATLRLTPHDSENGVPVTVGPFTLTNLVGDYSHDLAIDGADLPGFIDAWNTQTISREIGPVSGTPPQLTVHPDGAVDFEDLMAFGLMWNWYTSTGAAKRPMYADAAKTTLDGDDLTLVPDGTGRLQVMGSIPTDYVRLVVEPDRPRSGMISVTPGEVWDTSVGGMSFLRTYPDGAVEFAGGFVNSGSTGAFGSKTVLATIEGGQVIQLNVNYSIRRVGEQDIRSRRVYKESDGGSGNVKPTAVILRQNVPNPFNPTTTIEFTLPDTAPVRLVVYSVSGQPVAELVNSFMDAGMHSVVWNAAGMPSGMYFYVLEFSGRKETRKMLLMK